MFYKTIDKHLEIIFKNNKNFENELMFTSLFSRNNYYLEYFYLFKKKYLTINYTKLFKKKLLEYLFTIKIFIYLLIRILLIRLFIEKNNYKNKKINLFKIFYNPNSKIDKKDNKVYFEIKKNFNKKGFYYFPIIFNYSNKNLINIIQKLKQNDNFVYWEHHIDIKDIIKIFLFNNNFKIPNINYKKKNYKSFYKLNLNEKKSLENYYLSKIYFLFFCKVNKILKIEKFFAIWENQSADKAIFKSIKKNFPNCKNYGILIENFPISYISSYPTRLEILNNFIPDNILVPGIRMKNIFKRLSSKLKVIDFSLFKYQRLIAKNNLKNSNILLVLPIYLDECIFILEKISKILKEGNNVEIKIKFHPTINSNLFIKQNPQFSFLKQFITEENISYSIKKFNKVILGTSSLFYNLICSNIQTGVMSKRFNTIKDIYGIDSMNTSFLNNKNILKKFLNNKTINYKTDRKKFNKLYTPFKRKKLNQLWK